MITIKVKKSYFQFVLILVCIFFMFKMPETVSLGISKGLSTCLYTVLPSLFPFTVLSVYIIKLNIFTVDNEFLSLLAEKVFKLPVCALPVIILSLIGGFPIGAKLTFELLEKGQITKNQASRLNLFCVNGGPAFIILAVGLNMLKSQKAGVIMFISLCLSTIILGIISTTFDDKIRVDTPKVQKKVNSSIALSSSVTDGINTMLSICAWIILFSAITECMSSIRLNSEILLFSKSVLEVTGGCSLLSGKMPLPIITALLGFGGFCVHCQIFSFVSASGLKYSKFLIFRILNGILSATICYLILLFIPVELSTAVISSSTKIVPFSISAPSFFAVLIMCVILIFDIDSKKKIC